LALGGVPLPLALGGHRLAGAGWGLSRTWSALPGRWWSLLAGACGRRSRIILCWRCLPCLRPARAEQYQCAYQCEPNRNFGSSVAIAWRRSIPFLNNHGAVAILWAVEA